MTFVFKLSCILLMALTLFSSVAVAQEEENMMILGNSGHNFRPQAVYNPDTNEYFIAWVTSSELMGYADSQIEAVIVKAGPGVELIRKITVSRPSTAKTQAPYVAVFYHQPSGQYTLIWQEIENGLREMYLTTIDANGDFVLRNATLATDQGILLARPALNIDPASGMMVASWSELKGTEILTQILYFDPVKPKNRNRVNFTRGDAAHRFELALDQLARQDKAEIFGFIVDTNKGKNRLLYSRSIDDASAFGYKERLTSKRIRSSATLSATLYDDDTMILYDQFFPASQLRSLAILVQPNGGTPEKPNNVFNLTHNIFDGFLLKQGSDGLNRLVWAEEHRDGIFSLRQQTVSEAGDLIGEQMILRTRNKPITNPMAVYGNDGSSMFIVWCEDTQDENVRVWGEYIDLLAQ